MICCKIITDYIKVGKNFSKIFEELSNRGSVLWENRCFYFANVEDKNVTDKTIKKIFKKYECDNAFIIKYDKNYQPLENDSVNWWLNDKLIKIGYVEAEECHQEELKKMSQQLTELEKLLEQAKIEVSPSDQNEGE